MSYFKRVVLTRQTQRVFPIILFIYIALFINNQLVAELVVVLLDRLVQLLLVAHHKFVQDGLGVRVEVVAVQARVVQRVRSMHRGKNFVRSKISLADLVLKREKIFFC